jgi:3'-phosphoadenosine 5'-phosphosulfate sulfotransferase (PAPS reductase)/FAD synthetase
MIDAKLISIERPCHIAFSGGRTSAYMLHLILQHFGGELPKDVVTIFCNTGKEHEGTLEFVHKIEQEWTVPVV